MSASQSNHPRSACEVGFSETSVAPPEFAKSISGLAQPPSRRLHYPHPDLHNLVIPKRSTSLRCHFDRPSLAERSAKWRNLLFPSKEKAPRKRKSAPKHRSAKGSGDFRNPDYGPPPPASSVPGRVFFSNQRWISPLTPQKEMALHMCGSAALNRTVQQETFATEDYGPSPATSSVAGRFCSPPSGGHEGLSPSEK
jgi:hypothetical protein